jgi:hypothetical protein
MPLWQNLGQIVGQVVMFIAGIVAGLTGSTIDLTKSTNDASAAYQGLGGAAQDAAAGQGSVAGSTKSATDAITDQINALQDQKRAYDDTAEAQKAALQSQLDTLHDVTDSRRHQGEDIVTYERRLAALGLQDKIRAIDSAKSVYDRQVSDQIAALQRQQQAVKEASGKMGADLASGIGAGMNAGVAASAQAISKVSQQWADAGVKYGKWLVTWFSNPTEAIKQAADTFGQLLGSAIVKGAENAIGTQLHQYLTGSTGKGTTGVGYGGHGYGGHAGGYFGSTEHLAWISEGNSSEVVLPMSDRSRSLSLMEQSGMASLARSAGRSGGAGGAGNGLTVVINGNVNAADPSEVARLMRAFQAEARRKGFALSGGFG